MGLRVREAVAVTLLAAVASVAAVTSVGLLQSASDARGRVRAENAADLRDFASHVRSGLALEGREAQAFAADHDRAALTEIAATREDVHHVITAAQAPSSTRALRALAKLSLPYVSEYETWVDARTRGSGAGGETQHGDAVFDSLAAFYDGVDRDVADRIAEEDRRSGDARRLSQIALVVLGLIALSFLLVAAPLYAAGLVRQLDEVVEALKRAAREDLVRFAGALGALADGDLTAGFRVEMQPLPDTGRDEIASLRRTYNVLGSALGELGEEFARTTARLRDLVDAIARGSGALTRDASQVAGTAEAVRSSVGAAVGATRILGESATRHAEVARANDIAVTELARASAQIADGAAEQTQRVRSIAGTADALGGEIGAFNDVGIALTRAAAGAAEAVGAGSRAVNDAAGTMERIRSRSEECARVISDLERSSERIGEILAAIDAVSEQTNLLALNAAIEAARAGEHGRGFAVVAGEIRKLAERSASSTREISGILGELRSGTERVVSAVGETGAAVEVGERATRQTGEVLARIGAAVEETGAIASDVARRSGTMRIGMDALSSDVASVASVVEENAAAAEELRALTDAVAERIGVSRAASEAQAEATESIGGATRALSENGEQLATTAGDLRGRAGELGALVSRFAIGGADAPDALPA